MHLLSFILLNLFFFLSSAPTPAELASRVVGPVFSNPGSFLKWDYGGALIFDSLWQFASQFSLKNITPDLDRIMNNMETNPNQDGYKILHNITIPFGGAVGDSVGLFPIAFLARAGYYDAHPDSSYNNKTDVEIAQRVASEYIIRWPKTLPDGTFTRSSGWSGEPSGSEFLWDDDHYMGLTLISRLSVLFSQQSYAQKAGKMQLTFSQRLSDQSDQILWHGYNEADKHHSCCKWGRGNGWVIMSHVEALIALDFFKDPLFPSVLSLFQKHSEGLLKLQSPDGRWHQILTDSSTFLETSSTAMILWSYIEGVMRGWLPRDTYAPAIEKGWNGFVQVVKSDGTVTGITEGTGIGDSVQWYNQRSTNYLSSGPGLGSVFKLIHTYDKYKSMNL